MGAQNRNLIAQDDLRERVTKSDVHRSRLAALCAEFEHEGLLDQVEMESRYRRVLDALPQDAQVVIVLANEVGLHGVHPWHARLNNALAAVAAGRKNVLMLDPADQINSADDMIDVNHFKRDVYHRMYRTLLRNISEI